MTQRAPAPAAGASRQAPARPDVPWPTVVGLASVLALADWFWVIALRGATGAIERVQEPFTSWLSGALATTPLFVLAVLCALALARRRWGDRLRGAREVAMACLLVAAAGTVAAVAVHVVSAAYDFRLQVAQLDTMMHASSRCVGDCLDAREDATLALQLKTLGAGAAILLATNVVLVGWMAAVQGGRLRLVRPGPSGRTPWSGEVALVLVAGLAGVGTVHAALSARDLTASPLAGLLQLLLAVVALVCARHVRLHPGRGAWVAAAVVAGAPLAGWALAHSAVGLPFLPAGGTPDRIGLATAAVGVLDLTTVAAVVVLLCGPLWLERRPSSGHTRRLALVAVVATTAIGLGGSGIAALDLVGVGDAAVPAGSHQPRH